MCSPPNQNQVGFLDLLSASIADGAQGSLILGGDYNCVADVDLDRSHPPLLGSPTRTAQGFRAWMDHWGIQDTWRLQHTNHREFSFSPVH